ncbi:phenylacetic acid degradation PaaB family protein [Halostagnicola kamekurae]|uniref:Phenylacetic acid degradation B n=1 Tax=Halostagnicola kamekurae TaxID=619731 RepID=A0A1I6TN30_9EURY|nr:phenylacetic acid degradation PaaB family protein [Halostagnicola kamekurae]SFS90639.1 Phenylacetic acid degradation B [Halostagnicola kamekurae]
MKYEVFARINQGDDTLHIGTVTAQSDKLAQMYAYNTFDEEDWNYLAVVREENLHEVSGEQPEREVVAGE